jgi:hypothetical protein
MYHSLVIETSGWSVADSEFKSTEAFVRTYLQSEFVLKMILFNPKIAPFLPKIHLSYII